MGSFGTRIITKKALINLIEKTFDSVAEDEPIATIMTADFGDSREPKVVQSITFKEIFKFDYEVRK